MNLLSLITTIVVAVATASSDTKPFKEDKLVSYCTIVPRIHILWFTHTKLNTYSFRFLYTK